MREIRSVYYYYYFIITIIIFIIFYYYCNYKTGMSYRRFGGYGSFKRLKLAASDSNKSYTVSKFMLLSKYVQTHLL